MMYKFVYISVGICLLSTLAFASNKHEAKVNSGGTSAKDVTNDGPGPPTNVQVVSISSSELEITWEAPVGFDPDYYLVQWVCYGSSDNTIVFGFIFSIVDLEACSACFVTVDSVSNGDTYPSDTVEGTTDAEFPPQPNSCTIAKKTSTSVTPKWEQPATNCQILNYNLSWTWTADWSDEIEGEGSDTSGETAYTIKYIAPSSHVTVAIRAETEDGYGDPCECEDYTEEGVPSPPTVVSATEGPNYVSLTWNPPEIANGIITAYRITGTNDEGEQVVTTLGNSLTGSIYGLTPCRSYNITVAAGTSKDFGDESLPWAIDVTGKVPLTTVRCTAEGSRNFLVEWDHSNVTCLGQKYHINWNYSVLWSDQKDNGNLDVPGDKTTYEIQDAIPYTEYRVCVDIIGMKEEAVCCQNVTGEEAPSAPTIDTISAFRGDVLLSWSPPAEANGDVRSYSVSWVNAEGGTDSEEFEDVTEGVIKGLEVCSSYSLSVAALTNNWGEESRSKDVDIPNYVESVGCATGGPDKITASFEIANPLCKVSDKDTVYTVFVKWKNETYPPQTSSNHDVPAAGEETIFSLPPYSDVEVCMNLPNFQEEKACCTTTTDEDIASAPITVTVSEITTTTAVISWTMPHDVNGDIKAWIVTLQPDNQEDLSLNVPKMNMSVEAEDLQPSTWYRVEVLCRNGAGFGEAKKTSFTTLSDGSPNTGMIIGIVVGGVAAIAALVAGVVCFRKRRGRSGRQKSEPSVNESYDSVSVNTSSDSYEEHKTSI